MATAEATGRRKVPPMRITCPTLSLLRAITLTQCKGELRPRRLAKRRWRGLNQCSLLLFN